MIWKLIIMFFGYVVLIKAYRDSLDKKKDNKKWHAVGFLGLVWLAFWSVWLVNPLSWHFGAVMLLLGCGAWWLFDIAFNLWSGERWDHIGNSETEKMLGKNILLVKMILTFIAIVLAATI